MATTYEPIQSQTLSSAVSSVTFSSIPQTYTDLVLVSNVFAGFSGIGMRFNGDTASNYSYANATGQGTLGQMFRSGSTTDIQYCGWNYALGSTTIPAITKMNIMDYTNTSTYQYTLSTASDGNAAGNFDMEFFTGTWRNNAAVTSITLYVSAVNFSVGSTFTLYGIKAA
jgi:hypothetical protein